VYGIVTDNSTIPRIGLNEGAAAMVKRIKWEYHTSESAAQMAALGQEGWELTAVNTVNGKEIFYYKRPAPSVSESITLEQRSRVLKGGSHA
jgi:hypothetical protein